MHRKTHPCNINREQRPSVGLWFVMAVVWCTYDLPLVSGATAVSARQDKMEATGDLQQQIHVDARDESSMHTTTLETSQNPEIIPDVISAITSNGGKQKQQQNQTSMPQHRTTESVVLMEGESSRVLSPSIVCSSSMKAQFKSLFQIDTTQQAAQDISEMCSMCARLGRLSFLLRNDQRSTDTWEMAVRKGACEFVTDDRDHDCQLLLEEFLDGTRNWFTANGNLSTTEAQLSADQLGVVLNTKSLGLCKSVSCCPSDSEAPPRLWSPAPGSSETIKSALNKDLAAFRQEKTSLDNTEVVLSQRRRQLNMLRDKLTIWRADLKDEAVKLAAEKQAFEEYKLRITADLDERGKNVKQMERKVARAREEVASKQSELTTKISTLPKCKPAKHHRRRRRASYDENYYDDDAGVVGADDSYDYS
mmetsp:Transcript_12403/g.22539  ORF Transcript_12403/g.22539 Transcript_12403/m.22539 type:complete len:420 (-) Transcript_12403:132-1391(-)|eukprot:CAMPEP_0197528738 /NCGR_PEP_ID=MMETSP1318-20131121/26137_1 /TAXON_ID=552666 /ORGANISM="Partenskyella glossopodia, Strain RCC365" /LENGTH=419 /DNA_ID=CAMNT_0043083947 /DNA_START=111 /DNA_END=1370 /DNA_ORIENTATION=-